MNANAFTPNSPKPKPPIFLCLRSSAFICGSILLLISGCAPQRARPVEPVGPVVLPVQNNADVTEAMRLIDRRDQWETLPGVNIPRHPAEKFLKDVTIVVDPGHGGEDGGNSSTRPAGYKASDAGDKEAFINLRVALLLERLLKDAGASVIMTRHGDDTIGLTERAEVANTARRVDGGSGADLFVSIHHNAGGKTSNYPSVWYHGTVDDNEPDMDVARHIAQALGREMRTQVAKTSPIFSSQLMYDSGFGVLRACDVPAVLCESSFFSDPAEAERLRDPVYNLREAYAIYSGLCEWAYCGRPTQTMPSVTRKGQGWQMMTTLSEGLPAWWGSDRSRILRSSIMVTLNGRERAIRFDELTRELLVDLTSEELSGTHELVIHHQNMLKNSNWPQRYQLRLEGERVSVEQLEARRPRRQPATRPVPKP